MREIAHHIFLNKLNILQHTINDFDVLDILMSFLLFYMNE